MNGWTILVQGTYKPWYGLGLFERHWEREMYKVATAETIDQDINNMKKMFPGLKVEISHCEEVE